MTTALLSLALQRPVRQDMAMTGEVSNALPCAFILLSPVFCLSCSSFSRCLPIAIKDYTISSLRFSNPRVHSCSVVHACSVNTLLSPQFLRAALATALPPLSRRAPTVCTCAYLNIPSLSRHLGTSAPRADFAHGESSPGGGNQGKGDRGAAHRYDLPHPPGGEQTRLQRAG